jgi:uncharacterized RDD family membrane protein YckC
VVTGATPVATPPGSRASLARRLAALSYEMLILAAIFLVAGFVLAPLVSTGAGPSSGRIPILGAPERTMLFAGLFGVGALYCGWSWSGGRRTLPMKTWRMHITRRDGGNLDGRTALLRYIAAWIGPALALAGYVALQRTGAARAALLLLGVNYLWVAVNRDRQFLHDVLAGTRLVADAPRGDR